MCIVCCIICYDLTHHSHQSIVLTGANNSLMCISSYIINFHLHPCRLLWKRSTILGWLNCREKKKLEENQKRFFNFLKFSDKVINGSHQAVNGMYPIFEPGQKNFSNHNRNDWDSLNRELWVCKWLLPFVRKGNSGAQLCLIYMNRFNIDFICMFTRKSVLKLLRITCTEVHGNLNYMAHWCSS